MTTRNFIKPMSGVRWRTGIASHDNLISAFNRTNWMYKFCPLTQKRP